MTEISAWLGHLGLGQYAAIFIENAIDLDVSAGSNRCRDFERLGVPLGHRKRIIRAISTSATIHSRGAAVVFNFDASLP